ncbi:MAG TPA: AAA family ATPase [Saprospiraceae bacterium]|nr:AAA family ATPase [Saprospiraceae bacterium]
MLDRPALLLNDDFRHALDVLEKTDRSLFITGRAGTGKSTLLQLFRNTTRKKTAVLAPTGVAALNVQGQTIHSFFGFAPRIVTAREASRRVTMKHQKRLYQNVQVIVVDEISMVRADILDGMDRFLRVNRENNRPFGGVQMVFFGDLFQLPPVVTNDPVETAYFQDYYETPYFFSAKVMQEPDFELDMLELRKVYRQESRHFLRLLEAIRTNQLDYDDLDDLSNATTRRLRQKIILSRFAPVMPRPTDSIAWRWNSWTARKSLFRQRLKALLTPTFTRPNHRFASALARR